MYELIIQNGESLYSPALAGEVIYTTDRRGAPGKLEFTATNDGILQMEEGNPVRLTQNGRNIFFGFIFTQRRDKRQLVDVKCYDQLRYLKNKDTYVYQNKHAHQVIQMIAADFRLNLGELEQTGFLIPSRVEDNAELLDIIYTALDLEVINTRKLFVLFDDFGRLTLKSIGNMNITGRTTSAGAHRHTVPDSTDTGEAGNHAHDLAGPYTVQVMNGLRQGERVILARLSGGQRYLVLDRIGGGAA